MRSTLVTLLACVILIAADVSAGSIDQYEARYDSLVNPNLDSCARLSVDGLAFECDRARFELSSGDIYFFPTVSGKVYGCIFSGSGRITLDPPTPIEKFSLKKHLDCESLDVSFSRFRMMASPDLIETFFDMQSAEKAEPSGALKSFWKKTRNGTRKQEINLEAFVLGQFDGQVGEFLWIDMEMDKRRLAFVYDESDTEPVQLYRRASGAYGGYLDLVLSAFPMEHYESGKSWKHRDPVKYTEPLSYDIEALVTGRAHLRCKADLRFVSKVDSLGFLYASIYNKTDVDSVLDHLGRRLFVSKIDDEYGFSVLLHDKLSADDTASLTFYYHSNDIIEKTSWGDFYISSQTRWYPTIESNCPTMYDVEYQYPDHLLLIAVGEMVADSVTGDTRYSRWVTPQPERYVSFNYGQFDTLVLRDENIPAVKVFRGKEHTGDLLGPDMKEKVGADIIGSLQLYTHLYGEIPYDPIYVTEIPASHGQGSPGLLHLAWSTFQSEQKIWDAQFRAHEVAHQWWGHTVRYDSYHDQWMSEAFADFSSAWYVQEKHREDKKYFEILDEWKRDAVQKGSGGPNRLGYWNAGTEAGPIWLGQRLTSSKSSDYGTLVYSKGAYVIHMIRCMMKDWTTGSDERFIKMMREFVSVFYRRTATTLDLQRMIEKHIGQPMDWFFDQWIFDIHIPDFDFDKEIREEGGKFLVDVEVIQKEVPDDFKSIIPIRIDFGDDQWAVVSVTAIGRETHTTLPPLPIKPKKLDFNFYKAVLER